MAELLQIEDMMRLKLYFDKRNLTALAVVMAVMGVLCLWLRFPPWALLGFGALYFLIKSLKIELSDKMPWLWTAPLLVGSSIFSAYQVQYLLLDQELRAKISDAKMFQNSLCCLVVYLVVQVFANRAGLACIISHIGLMLLAGVNYFVYLFRGNEFIFSDLKSIATGLSVAGNYRFALDVRAVYAMMGTVLYVALARKFPVFFKRRLWMGGICISIAVLCGAYLGYKTENYVTETWEQKGSYRNGYILNFALSIRDSFVKEPKEYSHKAVEALEAQYGKTAADEGERPTLIVVMNESYADLTVVGDYQVNMEPAPFYRSLTENTVKGYALSSVFGAKTPNSEWEFLTGNSMAFLPSGSVVYQQYISEEPTSMVSNLKNIGYTCVAMHPYYETGWSRNTVYQDLGFDETYFLEDFDQKATLREYITDRQLYEKIIHRFEGKKEKEDLFIMSISMQNHGGYTEKYQNFKEEVRLLGANYPDVNQYLSLVHESDKALEYLISYFERVEEPVEIVFFGDHQPSLSSHFYPYLNGKGLSRLTLRELENLYTVPFFIWTNYESREEEGVMTSLNFLSALALEKAGIALPPYQQFLADLMEVTPAINARGYYSKSAGKFKHIEDAAGEEAEWISKYETLQYNEMFDRKGKSELFFPYLISGDTKQIDSNN